MQEIQETKVPSLSQEDPQEEKIISHEVMGLDAMIFVF